MRRLGLCVVLLLGAWNSPAPDVVLYCPPSLLAALRTASAHYTAMSHVPVHIFTAPPDGLAGLIKHRARADVVVADGSAVAELAAGGLVLPGSVVAVGRNPYVLIGKAGSVAPGGADAGALLASHMVVVPDPTAAASFDGGAVLRAALPGARAAHEIGVADTPEVIALVRDDAHLVGVAYQSDAHAPGVVQAARLAVPAAPVDGALVANGQSANAAALLAFIAGPAGAEILHRAGLEKAL